MIEQDARYRDAISDFRWARRRANFELLRSSLMGKSADLLAYDDVVKTLKISGYAPRKLREIPVAAIVGSVGRYNDFTRSFLPKEDHDERRWASVQTAVTGLTGTPPIEAYQIGDVYFVIDGNHRVSIARQVGAPKIEAYVTEVRTPIPFSPEIQPDDLIIKAEYAEFLKRVRLDELRPGADFSVTVPGKYQLLEQQIATHCFTFLDQRRKSSLDDAIEDWYDTAYLPVIRVMREKCILCDFPQRTETDLYLWITEHRAELQQALGWQIRPENVISDLVKHYSPRFTRIASRVRTKLADLLIPERFSSGPETGEWRRERMTVRREDRLFSSILVPLSGEARGWQALEQAIIAARREDGRLYGLHIVAATAQKQSATALAVKTEFERRCQAAGIAGEFAIEAGDIPRQICNRVGWTDLAVINLVNPPGANPLRRLKSPFRTVVRRSSRPVLAVPKTATTLARPLLAYDGSPKATEALYVSAYLAGQWNSSLVVLTVGRGVRGTADSLAFAQQYLSQRGIQAIYLHETGSVSKAVQHAVEKYHRNLIIMGGYDHSPLWEILFGSHVETILRSSQLPMLICR